jgi:dTDP-4-amino-4,6-dideoxygalactose transaminase
MAPKLAIQGGEKIRNRPYPAWPVFGKPEEEALLRSLRSGAWGRLDGEEVASFEAEFARFHEARHAIAVVNGTVSLRLALLAVGLEAGEEVIVPPYTFLSTASAVIEANGVPVFADIDPETCNLDPACFEEAITDRTRAVIPVHFAGLPAAMDRIRDIAAKHGLAVIEDAAHAHGASYRGRRVGALGAMGSFSFQSSKNLCSGEGGMILTDDDDLAAMARSLHNCGRWTDGVWYSHTNPGGNYRMSEFQGALLRAQLARLERQTAIRDENGLYLNGELARIPGITPQRRGVGETCHAYHLYVFRYDPEAFDGLPRARFLEALAAEGLPVGAGYGLPLYRQPLFAEKNFGPFAAAGRDDIRYGELHLPATERACEEACWIHHPNLLGTRGDMDDIVRGIEKVYANRGALL